jgi:hypothetical protein
MSKAGDVFENPVTGERGVARIGTEDVAAALADFSKTHPAEPVKGVNGLP